MGWWMASLYDRVMARTEAAGLTTLRRELLGGVVGDVIEIGAGTGINVDLYGPAVGSLVLVEPDGGMRAQLLRRTQARQGVVVSSDAAESLSLPDSSADVVVSTLVCCSVSDPARVLAEALRVLRPGGRLVFLEHVAAEAGSDRYRWQRRIEPVWRWVAGGCHLTRRTAEAIESAGFEMERLDRGEMPGAPAFVRPLVRGVARRPGTPS